MKLQLILLSHAATPRGRRSPLVKGRQRPPRAAIPPPPLSVACAQSSESYLPCPLALLLARYLPERRILGDAAASRAACPTAPIEASHVSR